MKDYKNIISLVKNSRGVYCLDTTMGCSSGMAAQAGGCYNDCYAAKSAKLYGHDFSKTVLRDFESWSHLNEVLRQIDKVPLDFIRIGCSGDPSENWEHTLKILFQIELCEKEIVIITRHWRVLTDEQLKYLSGLNICINTSVSAMDKPDVLCRSLEQYHRIKPYCKSVLRIVSCKFNLDNEEGRRMDKIQQSLFENELTIDTVFRPSRANPMVESGAVLVTKEKFNGKKTLSSKRNAKTYMGKCAGCKEMCGLNLKSKLAYPNRRGFFGQRDFFKKPKW